MTKLLWCPKSWKEFRSHPEMVYRTSNRLRAFNHHEILKSVTGISSEVLGCSVTDPDFNAYDTLIFQKHIHSIKKVQKFRNKADKLAILDLCDSISKEETLNLNSLVDLVICSNHELEDRLISNGLNIPSATVPDSHEADPDFIKVHRETERPSVTWYGIGVNYYKFVEPLHRILQQGNYAFRWAAEENPKWNNEWGFQKGVAWQLSVKEAWSNPCSWQQFIQKSDIGIVPVLEAVKSPHKVLNYMAYGIPVICSPTDAHKRVITHAENGFFASTADEWQYCLELLKDPETRKKIGNRARQSVLKRYSQETIATEYYQAITKRHDHKMAGHKNMSFIKKIRKGFFGP